METNNYPSWLVSVEQAKKLKEIGFNKPTQNTTSSDILESKRYKEENKIYSQNYILKESSYNANGTEKGISIPTWEQVFEWFREKEIVGTVRYLPILGKKIYIYVINAPFVSCEEEFLSYEEAREALVNRLIKEYTEYEQAKKEWEAFPCDCCN